MNTRLTSACSASVRNDIAYFVWSRYWSGIAKVSPLDAGTAIPFDESFSGFQSIFGLQCKLRWTIVMRLNGTDVATLVLVAEGGRLTWELSEYPLYWCEAAVARESSFKAIMHSERAMSI